MWLYILLGYLGLNLLIWCGLLLIGDQHDNTMKGPVGFLICIISMIPIILVGLVMAIISVRKRNKRQEILETQRNEISEPEVKEEAKMVEVKSDMEL